MAFFAETAPVAWPSVRNEMPGSGNGMEPKSLQPGIVVFQTIFFAEYEQTTRTNWIASKAGPL